MKTTVGVFLLGVLVSAELAQAQDSVSTTHLGLSINAGLKGLTFKGSGGIISVSQGASASYEFGSTVISIRYCEGEEFQFLTPYATIPNPKESMKEAAILVGIVQREKKILSSVSVGIGAASGVRRGDPLFRTTVGGNGISHLGDPISVPMSRAIGEQYQELRFRTVGIALEGQYFWTPWPHVGLGIYGYANINTETPFAGVLFCVRVSSPR